MKHSVLHVLVLKCVYIPGHDVGLVLKGIYVPGHDDGLVLKGIYVPGHDDGLVVKGIYVPGHDGLVLKGIYVPGHDDGLVLKGIYVPGLGMMMSAGCAVLYRQRWWYGTRLSTQSLSTAPLTHTRPASDESDTSEPDQS